MPIKKRNDNVSFVAIRFTVRTFPNEIAQHGFRNLGIDFICKRMPQHGRGNRQIKQAKPTAHKRQSASDIPLVLQRNRLKTDRDGNLAIDGLLQEFFVKTLNSSKDGKFPFGIFSQVFPSIEPVSRNQRQYKYCQSEGLPDSYLGKSRSFKPLYDGSTTLSYRSNENHRL